MSKVSSKKRDGIKSLLQAEADALFPQRANTQSKRPDQFIEGIYPTHVCYGSGAYLYTSDKRGYIDYMGCLGANLLGYNDPLFKIRIESQLSDGILFSLPSESEVEVGRMLIDTFAPFQDWQLRFLKTGTEACHAAVRIVRSYTASDAIYSCGYHGWTDEFIFPTEPAHGCIQEGVVPFAYGQIPKFPPFNGENIAGVIVEPMMLEPKKQWLKDLQKWCKEHECLLIFDEIITGCRVEHLTVAKSFGIVPDLLILGKAIANGMPLAVVMGPPKIMSDKPWFVSGTFCGETLSLAAAKAVIQRITNEDIHSQFYYRSKALMGEINSALPEKELQLIGYGTRCGWEGDEKYKALLWQESCKRGVLFGKPYFTTYAHVLGQQAQRVQIHTMKAVKGAVTAIAKGAKLEGPMPLEVFKR